MARLTIDTGTVGNTATGDSIRSAFTKVNANFEEIYNELGSSGILSDLSFAGNTISTDNTNQNLILDPNGTGKVIVEGTVELGGLSFDSQTITGLTTNSNIKLAPAGTGSIDVDTSRIINVTDPSSAQDAATKNYVDTQLSSSSHNITFVGDDSTGTAVTQGETFKFAGSTGITTAVSGDTLTITGPDLTNYLNSTQISVSGNKISTTESNANIELDPNGTGDVIVNSGDILPATDNTQYLGSASKRWHTVYVGPGSINIAGASITNVGGILKIPGGVEGTQGLSGLYVLPSDLPYGGENDVQGSLFNYDGTTVFYEQSTWTNIKYYVDNVAGYSGWVVGDALPTNPITGTFDDPSGTTIVPATFSATTSGNNLVSLKLLTGGSGLGAGASDNILAFRVGDPITTYAVTPYGGILGTANSQGTIQSDSTFTGSVNVNGNLFLHDSVDAYSTISMNSNKITDLGTPTDSTDAATKGYVDTQLSSSSHNITFVGDDSTGTAVTQGETFKIAGTQNITTAVSGDTLTITGPDLSSYATQSYVTSQGFITNSTTTIVGDDSTGTTLNSGETIKVAGTQNVSTAVSGDTLTITGPDLSSYLTTVAFADLTSKPTTLSGYGITDAVASGSTAVTVVGDDSTGTAVTLGETFKIAGTQNITTAVSGDSLTITGPDLSSYATQSYVTSQGYITNSTITVVGDDSTGTSFNTGETIKVLGAGGITGSVSGDTLTVDGSNLLQYARVIVVGDDSTGSTFDLTEANNTLEIQGAGTVTTAVSGNTVTITGSNPVGDLTVIGSTISSPSNADITVVTSGSGRIVAGAPLEIQKGYIEAINALTSSSTITVDFSTASVHTVTLTSNAQFVVTNLPTGGTGTIIITQDGGGSNLGTFGTDVYLS